MSGRVADDAAAALAALARSPLLPLPSPLEPLAALSRSLGRNVWIKRDDIGGPGLGGNKLRKLELILAEALTRGIDTLVTTGGVQSNHARLTAAVAARAGLRCELFLKGERPEGLAGNLLLDTLFGAEIRFCGPVEHAEIARRMAARVAALADEGRSAMLVPLGGATPLGTLGYAAALRELLGQLPPDAAGGADLHVAGGTGSTAAGLALGAALWAPGLRIVVTSASWSTEVLGAEIARHFHEAAARLGCPGIALPGIVVEDGQVGAGYTLPTPAAAAALRRLAAGDGIVLDMTYTSKAMAGLIAGTGTGTGTGTGAAAPGRPAVFVHTGGTPELFTRTPAELGLAPG